MIERDVMRQPLVRPTLARIVRVSCLAAFCAAFDSAAATESSQTPVIHHDLQVTLEPGTHRLKVRDRIRVPGAFVTAPFTISLNGALNVLPGSGGLKLFPVRSRVEGSDSSIDRDNHGPAARVPVNVYGVEGAVPGQELTGELNYEGVIDYKVRESGGEYARAFSQSPGLIESRGVYLAGSTHWVAGRGCASNLYAHGRTARWLEIGEPR